MERIRHKLGRTLLVASLLLNVILLGAAGLTWKTNWLDAPMLSLIVRKNCTGGNLLDTQDNQAGERLIELVCGFSEEKFLP